MTKSTRRRSGDVRAVAKRKPPPGAALVKPDDVVLLPVEAERPDMFLVLADHAPRELGELLPTYRVSPAAAADLSARLGPGAGLANIGLQGLNGLQAIQGLVRLTPETMQLLNTTARPIVQGGANLGTLVGENGKFVAQVRWLPATGASVAGVMAALGPAVTLAAMQFQLASISNKLDRLTTMSSEILRASRTEKWSEVIAEVENLHELGEEASELGSVTKEVFVEAQGAYRVLSKRRKQLTEDLATHRIALAQLTSSTRRREWFRESGGVAFLDAQCLVVASTGCLYYQYLRAQNVGLTDPKHAEIIGRRAHDEAERTGKQVAAVLGALDRQLQLVVADPGSKRFYMLGLDRAPADALAAARDLSTTLGGLGVSIPAPRVAVGDRIRGIGHHLTSSEPPLAVLKLHLDPDETLEQLWRGQKSDLCLTDARLYRCPIDHPTEIIWSVPWPAIQAITSVPENGNWDVQITDTRNGHHRIQARNKQEAETWVEDLRTLHQFRRASSDPVTTRPA